MFLERFVIKPDNGATNNSFWKRYQGNPIINPIPGTIWAEDWICNEPILRIEDRYVMYMEGKTGPSYRIGLMTAKTDNFDGIHWEDYSGNPILDVGPMGYDAVGVLNPSVIFFQNQYFMYYTAIAGPPDQMCLALSQDGYHFTKYEKNPLFPGRCAFTIIKDNVIYLYYILFNQEWGYDIHLATSVNGVDFTKYSKGPILERGKEGEWDSYSMVTPLMYEEDGLYYLLYAADFGRTDEPRGFGVATSRDLVTWDKFPGNPIFTIGKPGEWDSEAIWCPWVQYHNEQYWMWYCGSATTYRDGLTPQVGFAILD